MKKRNKGFTMIELLATFVILALILSIAILGIGNIIKNSKEKSYRVTVNNIEGVANGYAIENYMKHEWLDVVDDNNKEYFCVSVGDLIDTGFLGNEVLDSNIGDDKYVEKNNYIYLERDKSTKTVTKNLLVNYYDDEFESYCNDYKTGVDIEFIDVPSGWAKEKKVTINYKIFNLVNNLSDYKYKYEFIDDIKIDWKNFDGLKEIEVIDNIISDGIITASIKSSDLNVVSEYEIGKIDRTAPRIEISLDGKTFEESKFLGKEYAKKRNVSVSLVDEQSGLKNGSYTLKYEWSVEKKTCDELANSIVFNVDGNEVTKISNNFIISDNTGMGKLYVCSDDELSDNVGNIRDNELEDIDVYLDNVKPVISVGNYTGDNVGYGSVIIPLIVTDKDSGIKKDSFTSEDITVVIGDGGTKSILTLMMVDEDNYNLKIDNSDSNGKISLIIDKNNVLDNALNGNDYIKIDTGISFSNKYLVSYVGNGGSGVPNNQFKYYNKNLTLSRVRPVRDNYDFIGWNTKSDGSGTSYSPGDIFNLNEDTVLYAQWSCYSKYPSFTYTGSFEFVKDDDTIIDKGTNKKVSISDKYYSCPMNWKIRFLTSGTLTFHDLGSDAGIDVFLVGGGGNGGGTYYKQAGRFGFSSGGGGGGGGYRTLKNGVSVSLSNSYSITIGKSGQITSAFGYTAEPGKDGATASYCDNYINGGVGGSTGGKGGYNAASGLDGDDGSCEFNDCSFSSRRYGGGGGGGHGHNGRNSRGLRMPRGVGKPGSGGLGGGGTGNNQYWGTSNHNGQANTGGGGGGGSFVFDKYDACKDKALEYYDENDCNCWSINNCFNVSRTTEYLAGKGGSGIVIIRNSR